VLCVTFYRAVIPAVCQSTYARRFKDRISQAIRHLFADIRDDIIAQMISLCDSTEDEEFEPYLDFQPRTCPPCDFIDSPPKEGIEPEENNNENSTNPPVIPAARRGRGRGRARAQPRGRAHPIRPPLMLPFHRLPVPQLLVRELEPLSPPPIPQNDENARVGDRVVVLVNDLELMRQEVGAHVDHIEIQLFRRHEP